MPICIKKYIWAPWNFLKNENFDARAPAPAARTRAKILEKTSKIIPDLWLLDLF